MNRCHDRPDLHAVHSSFMFTDWVLCRHGAAAVSFGDSPQDVWAQLGAPSGAALRGGSPVSGQPGTAPDFFYSYRDRYAALLLCLQATAQ